MDEGKGKKKEKKTTELLTNPKCGRGKSWKSRAVEGNEKKKGNEFSGPKILLVISTKFIESHK